MREHIQKNKEFNIISRSIDNASSCIITDVSDESFTVKLDLPGKYETGESVEMFSSTSKGQLYFETVIKEASDGVLSIWFPIIYKYLQRREYSRVKSEKEIKLYLNGEEITAKIVDISAGGLRVDTEVQLQLLKEYKTFITIDSQQTEAVFQPIRTEAFDGRFLSSGRFKNITNHDRIALVQYCFVKQIETLN